MPTGFRPVAVANQTLPPTATYIASLLGAKALP